MAQTRQLTLMRAHDRRAGHEHRFFDLVYVFAVTQLPHYLLAQPTLGRCEPGSRPL